MAKRILIFSLNYYPHFVGGAEVAIKEITDRLPPDEYECHVLTLWQDSTLPQEERIGNVIVHRIGLRQKRAAIADLQRFPLRLNLYGYQLFAAHAASKLHRSLRFDAVWAMMAHSCGIPAGHFKKRHPDVPYLLTLQEGDPPEYIERLMRPVSGLFRQSFARADALQAISSFLARWGKRMGYAGTPVVIPNGVDVASFAKTLSPDERKSVREELSIPEGATALVTTSRLVHKNGIDTVLRAMPDMPKEVQFFIYGIGPEEPVLRTLAKELGVEDRVRFMGQIGHAHMPRMLAACDIFIRPSRSEGMGNSFIEAMAAGLPVIATQEGGIADFLFDAERNPERDATGWAVDADSPEGIVRAVARIQGDAAARTRPVAAARAMALKDYDWNTIAQDMRALFDTLTSR